MSDTCRHCGQPIQPWSWGWRSDWWEHSDTRLHECEPGATTNAEPTAKETTDE